jgi:hypothetical protein
MNRIPRTISLLAALALATVLAASAPAQPRSESPPATNNPSDTLLFRNGDLLYGQLLSIDAQSAVRWRHPDAAEPIDFKPDAIAQIDFPTPKDSTTHSNNPCRLLLADGDTLEGGLVSCDRTSITLQTWYAGRLNIPRASLQSLVFLPRSPAVFDGITGLDGWIQGASVAAFPGEAGQWVYRNGAFYAGKAASIARDLKLPDVAEIQFDLAWKGSLNLAVAIYTDSMQPILLNAKDSGPDFGGFYSVRFQNAYSFSVDCSPIKKAERIRSLGQLFLPSFATRDRLHVDLRVSKPQHKIALYLDDTPVKEWVDTEGFIGEGTGMRFVQNLGSVLKLSNLRITKWDGFFSEPSTNAPDLSSDTLWPENGANVTGVIESIASGKFAVRTTNGPVEIPLAELKAITFSRPQTNPPPTGAATVRATFTQGGSLSFILESWQPDGMIVKSPDFGKVKINPAAFTRLQFLLPEKKPEGPKG